MAPPDGRPATANTTLSSTSPMIPATARDFSAHRGSLGSTRYQWPSNISPVTPPKAIVAERAGAQPPTNIAWIARAIPAATWNNPDS